MIRDHDGNLRFYCISYILHAGTNEKVHAVDNGIIQQNETVRPVDPLNLPTEEKIPGFPVHTTSYKVRLEARYSPNGNSMYNGHQ
ncbi:hypothetical protein DdX_18060 [Ditylenchus destructor]|uniref:Uncharacterized protein n=1 Tax=Ditylenchus destructor TaxID=166010 RepID=A0AAD4MLF4_9BILA|nr:hypothetical protein DdX_18060 [Ditylenchus destructor]